MKQKIEGGKTIRANNKESVCVYCGSKIGTKMKCDGCGTIDPPVTTKPQKIEGGKKIK